MPRIEDGATRAFAAVVVLIVVWIVVYWVTPPGGQPAEELRFEEPVRETIGAGGDSVVEPGVGDLPADSDSVAENDPGALVVPGDVIPPSFRDYTTQEGDSFETIAKQFYGAYDEWRVIARANPFVDPNRLRPGRVLRLPVDPENVEGIAVGTDGPAVPPEPELVEYTVSRGDTLSEIANRYYGSTKYTRFLFEANRGVLRSPDSLRLGQTLVIPPKPPEDGD